MAYPLNEVACNRNNQNNLIERFLDCRWIDFVVRTANQIAILENEQHVGFRFGEYPMDGNQKN